MGFEKAKAFVDAKARGTEAKSEPEADMPAEFGSFVSQTIEAFNEKADALQQQFLFLSNAQQLDLFVLTIVDASLKSDIESMEAPLFALGTNDIKPFHWESRDGKLSVTITPPERREGDERAPARATIHDKDILIYLTSRLVAAIEDGAEMPGSRRVRFVAHDFFTATNRDCSKDAYERLKAALERLTRTYVRIRYKDRKETLWKKKDEGFNLLSRWSAVLDERDERMTALEVELSEPLADAIERRAVLTLHPNYFRIRQPLAKRLYDIARKHCGKQGAWQITLENLHHKVGTSRPLRNFKGDLKKIIDADAVPGYRLHLNEERGMVTIYDCDQARAAEAIVVKKLRR